MESDLNAVATVLAATGPYGLLAVLWSINVRAARALETMHEQVVDLATQQTEAITKVEAALVALKEVVRDFRDVRAHAPEAREHRVLNGSSL